MAHVSDIATFYGQLIDAILRDEQLPSGENGHYFLVSHVVSWWDILDRLASRLQSRGLIPSSSTKIWPSDEMAAESIGVPVKFAYSMWNARYVLVDMNNPKLDNEQLLFNSSANAPFFLVFSSPKVQCEKKNIFGWKPTWNKEKFLERLDDEIDDYLELGMPKSSLLDSVRAIKPGTN